MEVVNEKFIKKEVVQMVVKVDVSFYQLTVSGGVCVCEGFPCLNLFYSHFSIMLI